MKLLLKLFLLTQLLFSITTHAAVFVEPGLGYNISGNLSDTDVPARDEDATGLGYYLRLGYQHLGLFGGVSYGLTNLTLEDKQDTTNPDEDWGGKELGAFIGYELPVMLRFWGGYIFDTKLEREVTSQATKKIYSGNGYKFGLGYKVIPLVSLNLEYKVFTYDEEEDDVGAVAPLTGVDEIEHKSIFLSVSVPFSF